MKSVQPAQTENKLHNTRGAPTTRTFAMRTVRESSLLTATAERARSTGLAHSISIGQRTTHHDTTNKGGKLREEGRNGD